MKSGQRVAAVRRGFTRRELLYAGGAALVVTATAGACSGSGGDGSGGEAPGPADADAMEAPMLADRVAAGELPPVGERLPERAPVVEPTDQLGEYGGQWDTVLQGAADVAWLGRTIGYEQLMRWDIDFTEPKPNVAESIESSEDGRSFVIKLRPGMKWSDGAPFTADDLVFWYNDVLLNEQYPSLMVPAQLTSGADGQPATIQKVDDHTVQLDFAAPNGILLQYFASADSFVGAPRHYLEQFHPTYNPDVATLAANEGYDDWVGLFDAKSDTWGNPERPTVAPWMIVEPLGAGPRVMAERNPYYWKVDPEGRQLPYIDNVVFDVVNEDQTILLRATNGELDMHMRHINNLTNKPVLAQNRENGGYEFFDLTRSTMNLMMISLNLTHKNPVLREVFQNKDFRIGLSHAIDRDELIAAVYQDQGEAWQVAPRKEAAFYDEELAKQYTEYDLDEANSRLDRAGYAERDGDGFRLGPDGQRIRFSVEVTNDDPAWVDSLELIKGHWAEVGIDIRIAGEDRSLLFTRKEANEHDAAVWYGSAGLTDALFDPRCYLPTSGSNSDYAVTWGHWYNGTGQGVAEEPPETVKEQQALYRQLQQELDRDRQMEIFREILRIAKDEFYAIGTVLPVGDYGIVKNDFKNVPASMIETGGQFPSPGATNPEQYFISGS
ncbi:ABC transporter substrate-binding protein [Jiangella anatolica]|uniref:ABC transporter substrate-binding protein n=1 Tax=Jiangella anatolica TaxID=2670374 RepID=A0A2W2BXL6_9ACTN|nr:ABC transporter substrate-binding protein [Jiangella anatolica]PZF80809.1 ABC transporter substrate-binding protein [Jiangella anatolica]